MSTIPRWPRQEDHELKASIVYQMKNNSKQTNKSQTKDRKENNLESKQKQKLNFLKRRFRLAAENLVHSHRSCSYFSQQFHCIPSGYIGYSAVP